MSSHGHHLADRARNGLHHVVEALDSFDNEMDSLRRDVHDGVHDALFDPEALKYASTAFFDGPPNLQRPVPGDREEVPE